MTKLELELTLQLLDEIINNHIDEEESGDRTTYNQIYGKEIEKMRNEIKTLIKKVWEIDE